MLIRNVIILLLEAYELVFRGEFGKRFIREKSSAPSPPQHGYQPSPDLFFQRIVGNLFSPHVDDDFVEMMADQQA